MEEDRMHITAWGKGVKINLWEGFYNIFKLRIKKSIWVDSK